MLFKGNNSLSIKKIEKKIGFKFPKELEELYFNFFLTKESELKFRLAHLTNNWIVSNYNFWLLISDENSIEKFDIYKKENTNRVSIIKASEMLKNSLNENVLCFAWSHDCIERDTGLFFKEDGKIYGFSQNFSDNKNIEFIANNLSDIFSKKLDETKSNKIQDILKKNQWHYADSESVDNVSDYEKIISDFFINISNKKINLDNFLGHQIDSKNRKIEIIINQQSFAFELSTCNGWIDTKLVYEMNEILKKLGISRRQFVEIKDSSWGQELGIAFASKNQVKSLGENGYLKK